MTLKKRKKRPKRRLPANIVGPQIRKLRYELGFTQERFAAKCQVHGFDISRATFSQIEAQLRCISDLELLLLARVLKVSTDDLFPPKMRRRKRR
jgi:transcriptional regulator with XRE-family HTH domain